MFISNRLMGFQNYGSGYVRSEPLTEQIYSAGATRKTLGIKGEGIKYLYQYGKDIFLSSFAPSGAKLQSSGNKCVVEVTTLGDDRVVALIKAASFRQVTGHTPKVWHTSEARCEGGLLVVAVPGFVFESYNYKRPWQRFVLTLSGIEEIPMAEEPID
jgi:hypothetical protein